MHDLAIILHTIFCNLSHSSNVSDLTCYDCEECTWYLETSMSNPWDYPAHEKWLQNAEKFLTTYHFSKPSEATSMLQEIIHTIRFCQNLFDNYPESEEIFKELLNQGL